MKRYSDNMNAMIRRGVSILNDLLTADMVPSGFRPFVAPDSGPRSKNLPSSVRNPDGTISAVSRSFRILEVSVAGQTYELPEKWLKFEKPAGDLNYDSGDGHNSNPPLASQTSTTSPAAHTSVLLPIPPRATD
jgi:hypothetical protein